VDILLAGEAEIAQASDQLYGHELSIDGILNEIESGESDPFGQPARGSEYAQPVVRLIDALLTDAVKRGASDLHFEPEAAFLRIRYRIDGLLRQIRALHKSCWPAMAVRLKVMAGLNIAETRNPQDGRISLQVSGRPVDFRVSTQPTIHGENIVLRILDRQKGIVDLDALGLTDPQLDLLKLMIARPEGLILVTGPTGSGKTTTLYSILGHINAEGINIMTLEDPVEYPMPMIRQTAVADAARLDFANGVRAMLRQDPDVILVGEIRDEDTARMAFQAAMTGHQVYSTLHTSSAIGAIPRLLDIGILPDILAGNVIGIVAQRLVRCLCPACREARPAHDYEMRLLGLPAASERPSSTKPAAAPVRLPGLPGPHGDHGTPAHGPGARRARRPPGHRPRDPRSRQPQGLPPPRRRRRPARARRRHHPRRAVPGGQPHRPHVPMTPYAYRAVSPGGQIVRGRLDARDLPDLERRLARLGLELLRAGRPSRCSGPAAGHPRRELINFCFHLEQFLQAGVPILDSLADLRDSLEHPRFRPVVANLITAIEGGQSLRGPASTRRCSTASSAASSGPASRPASCPACCALAAALKRDDELAAFTRRIAIYPLIVCAVILAAIGVALIYVVPELARLFQTVGQALPLQTRILIALSGFVRGYGWLLALALVAGTSPSATPSPPGPASGTTSTPSSCACRSSAKSAASSSSPASPASSP
jgi:Tfp pilus assembly pilus retraction ATPase PilT